MKQTFILYLLVFMLVLSATHPLRAQEEKRQEGYGLGIKASTTGFGGDIIYGLSNNIVFRLGMDRYSYSTNIDFSEQGISYTADILFNLGTISLIGDFYLAKIFYVSVGAGYNLFNVNLEGHAAEAFPFGDIEIQPEMIGNFDFNMHPNKPLTPYIGIGLGRTLSLKKKVGFAVDLGGYYLGAPQIDIVSDGFLSPTSNPEHHHAEKLEKQVSQYNFLPIIKLSLNYRLSGE